MSLQKANQETFTYSDNSGEIKKLDLIKSEFSLKGLTDNEIEALQILQNAQKHFAKINLRQNHTNGLEHLLKINQSQNNELKNFFSINSQVVDGQNSQIQNSQKFINQNSINMGFYPKDLTDEEFENLPNEIKNQKHSIVIRDETGQLKAIKNSVYFKDEILPVIKSLNQVKQKVPELENYVNSTIDILTNETNQTMINQFREWRNNDSNIDYVFETAQEIYDKRGIRGVAEADTFRNMKHEYGNIIDLMLKYVKEIDQNAPWTHKAENLITPTLRFVDVLSYRGNHATTPAITLGQNLPDEQFLRDEVGCITMVYANILKAKKNRQASFFRTEFFPHINENLEKLIAQAELYLVAGHEFTHGTSKVLYKENPHILFNPGQYSIIEEARAETGALFYMSYLQEKGEIDETLEEISYYTMLETMMDAKSKQIPTSHRGARSLMFHYMLDNDAITEHTDLRKDNLPTYKVNIKKARIATKELLGILGDIRSEGKVEQADQLIKKYIRTDNWNEFEQRFKERGSQGVVFNFPIITGNRNEGFNLEYKDNFYEHPNSAFQTLK